jgi:KUP system potassium uptake protein
VGCLLLVVGFQKSERLASAYGIAVTGTMALTSVVYYVVMRHTWKWPRLVAAPLLAVFLAFDIPFFLANTVKILDGGWVPILIGVGFIAAMLIWSKGRSLVFEGYARRFGSVEEALPRLEERIVARVPGLAVFMASSTEHVPPILVHFVERTRSLHREVLLLTVITETMPTVPVDERIEVTLLGKGFRRVVARYGFMETPDVPAAATAAVRQVGLVIDPEATTFFLGRESVLARGAGAMGRFAEGLFGYLQRNAVAADRVFQIPPQQVIEVGIQLDL